METRLQGGMCFSLCSQGTFGLGGGRCHVRSCRQVKLLLPSLKDPGQGKVTGSGSRKQGQAQGMGKLADLRAERSCSLK